MTCLRELRRMPIRSLRPADHFVIGMTRYMQDIRAEANRARLNGWVNRGHQHYLTGRLDGLRFGMSTLLIYSGNLGDLDLLEWGDALLHEADFLCGEYQKGIES